MDDLVYKVVAATLKDYHGEEVLSSDQFGPQVVDYMPKWKSTPVLEGSYLYAFLDADAALAYIKDSNSILKPSCRLQIWEAKAQIVALKPCRTSGYFVEFWENKYYAMEEAADVWWTPCVEGTVWCEWIQLTTMFAGEHPKNPDYRKK
jgi:hypothetical protein